MTIQTNNNIALPKSFLRQESYSGLCHPRSLLCHSRSKVGVGRIIMTGREGYWLNLELQITVGFCWQIRRFLCEGCFEEETIPTDRSTLSHNRPHPVSTAFTLSRLLLSIISLTNTNTSTNTNTNTNITSKKGGKNICTKKRGSISDLMRFYFQQEWVRPGDGGKHQQDLLRPRQHVSCHWFWFGIISFSHEHRDEKHDENTLIGIVIGDQKGPNIRGSTGSLWALCCSTQLSFWGFTAIQWHPHHLYSCTPAPLGNTMYTAICTLLFAIAI